MRVQPLPLVVALTATSAGALGLGLGAFLPSWGLAGGVALALGTFGAGLWTLPEHRELRAATLLLAAATLAFVLTSAPRTWLVLDAFGADLPEPARPTARLAATEALRAAIWKWTVMSLSAVGALAVARRAPRRALGARKRTESSRAGGRDSRAAVPPAAATIRRPAMAATEVHLGDDRRGGDGT
jgi:hypothetical protein